MCVMGLEILGYIRAFWAVSEDLGGMVLVTELHPCGSTNR